MASTDSRPIPRKNVAYRVSFPIFDADGDPVPNATGLDSEFSGDGGSMADCANEAVYITGSAGAYYLDLVQAEMNYDTVYIEVKTSTSGAKTTPIILYPEELGDLRVDVGQISGDATAADNAESFFDGTGYAGTNNVIPTVTTVNGLAAGVITAAAIATDAIDADALKADAVTEIQSGLATASAIAALNNLSAAAVNAEVDTALADVGLTTTITGRIDAAISTRLASGSYTAPPTADAIADQVWEETLADHTGTSGSTAEALNAAGAAGDPWSTALPGAYGSGSAGKIIGDNLNATISSRASQTSVDTVDDFLDTEVAAIKAKTDNLPSDPADASDVAASFASLASTLSTIAGYIDTEVAAIKAKTDNLPAAPSATGDIPSANTIADAVLTRSITNTENSATVYSLTALILAAFESAVSGATWTIKKSNGTTTFATRTVTTDAAAEPVVGVE